MFLWDYVFSLQDIKDITYICLFMSYIYVMSILLSQQVFTFGKENLKMCS